MDSIRQVVEAEQASAMQLEELRQKLEAAQQERTRIISEADAVQNSTYEEDINRLIEEPASTELRRWKLIELRDRQAAIEAEVKALTTLVQGAETAHMEDTRKKVDVVLTRVSHMRKEVVSEIREALSELAPSIASLVTSDIVQTRLLGDQLKYNPESHPDLFSGRELAAELLKGIPDRLRPSALYSGEIEDGALWFAQSMDFSHPDAEHPRLSKSTLGSHD